MSGENPNEEKKEPKVLRGAAAQVRLIYSCRNATAFALGKQHHLARILVRSNPTSPVSGAPSRSHLVQRKALRNL